MDAAVVQQGSGELGLLGGYQLALLKGAQKSCLEVRVHIGNLQEFVVSQGFTYLFLDQQKNHLVAGQSSLLIHSPHDNATSANDLTKEEKISFVFDES